jgi:ATP-dependent Clp protease adaptor protein ClpS
MPLPSTPCRLVLPLPHPEGVAAGAATVTETVPETKQQKATAHAKKYQLILLDDEEHSYAYVIEMVMTLFGLSYEEGYRVAYDTDFLGQATIKVCSLEEAMVGREQIQNYGPDHRLKNSRSSMKAIVQEADA